MLVASQKFTITTIRNLIDYPMKSRSTYTIFCSTCIPRRFLSLSKKQPSLSLSPRCDIAYAPCNLSAKFICLYLSFFFTCDKSRCIYLMYIYCFPITFSRVVFYMHIFALLSERRKETNASANLERNKFARRYRIAEMCLLRHSDAWCGCITQIIMPSIHPPLQRYAQLLLCTRSRVRKEKDTLKDVD